MYHLHTNTKKHRHICKQSNSQPYMFDQHHPNKSTSVVAAFWYIVMIIVSTLEPLGLVSPTLYVYHHNNTFKQEHLMWKLISVCTSLYLCIPLSWSSCSTSTCWCWSSTQQNRWDERAAKEGRWWYWAIVFIYYFIFYNLDSWLSLGSNLLNIKTS